MSDLMEMFAPLDMTTNTAVPSGSMQAAPWRPILPVPDDGPEPPQTHPMYGAPSMRFPYLDEQGRLLGYVYRFDRQGERKQFAPLTFGSDGGKPRWHWTSWSLPRPLYGLNRLAARPDATVIVVEGEKAADAASNMLPSYVAVTTPGGAMAARKADLTALEGRHVVIWPDNDEPGTAYAMGVADVVRACGAASVRIVTMPLNVFPTGWDLADPLPSVVSPGQVKEMIVNASDVSAAQNTSKKGLLPLFWANEIEPVTDATDFVEGLLTTTALVAVYGESNTGKTFWTLDLGFHVALGWEWQGRHVDQGGVIYVAAEGGNGIFNRVDAFKRHYGIDGEIPFAVAPLSVNLLDPAADTPRLIETVREAAKKRGLPVRLIIIDTLARAIAGGNENSSDDMGALINNAGTVQKETGATVLFIHHCGKDVTRGARGHSSLRAALDTEIEITRDARSGIAVARVTKQRDLPCEGEFAFSLKRVEVGRNKREISVVSCVVVPEEQEGHVGHPRLSGQPRIANGLLTDVIAKGGRPVPVSSNVPQGRIGVSVTVWKERCLSGGLSAGDTPAASDKAFSGSRTKLVEMGLIGVGDGWVWLMRGQDDAGHVQDTLIG